MSDWNNLVCMNAIRGSAGSLNLVRVLHDRLNELGTLLQKSSSFIRRNLYWLNVHKYPRKLIN